MRKHSKRLIYTIIIALVLVGDGIFLLNTEQGLRSVFAVISRIIPGELTAQKLSGCLLSPIDVENFSFENSAILISVNKAHVEWKAKDLLFGKIKFTSIHADGLKINIKSSSADQNKSSLKDLMMRFKSLYSLIHLKLKDVLLNDVLWQQGTEPPVKIESITLRANLVGENIISLDGELHAQKALIVVQGSLQKEWNMDWKLYLPSLRDFSKELEGLIDCEGRIYGERDYPEFDTTFKIEKFKYDDISFVKLQGKAEIDLSTKKKSQIELNINLPKINSINFNQLNFSSSVLFTDLQKQFFEIDIDLGPTTASFPMGAKSQSLRFEKESMHGVLNVQGFFAKGNILISGRDPINVDLKLPKLKSLSTLLEEQPVEGLVTWKTRNLAFLQTAIPDLKNLQGALDVQYVISGTLQESKLNGVVKLTNGSFELPDLNLKLQNALLSAENVDNKIKYQGSMHSGGGVLNFSGETVILGKDIKSKVAINGTNFLVVNTREYNIIASPQLELQIKNDILELTGKIFVPKAIILSNYISYGGLLPQEVVIVKKGEKKPAKNLNLYANIRLDMGNDVVINVSGLKGRVAGQLQLVEDPNKITTASGTLYIKDGSYSIYGQQLKVIKGDLHFFGGAVTNPRVNIEAIRDFKSAGGYAPVGLTDKALTVGIRMNGLLDTAKVNLFSIPGGLSNGDILSYLIIGQPSEQAAGNKAQLLLQAATALNFGGAGGISNLVNKLRDKLGLSEFGLTEEISSVRAKEIGPTKFQAERQGDSLTTNTAFSLGKFLTPKIYVGYSMRLIDQVNIFRARYYMGHYWAIQSESSSAGSGGDILYTIESD